MLFRPGRRTFQQHVVVRQGLRIRAEPRDYVPTATGPWASPLRSRSLLSAQLQLSAAGQSRGNGQGLTDQMPWDSNWSLALFATNAEGKQIVILWWHGGVEECWGQGRNG